MNRPCPLCKIRWVAPHCESPTCGWHVCPECKATFDLAAGRGFDKDNRPVTWAA